MKLLAVRCWTVGGIAVLAMLSGCDGRSAPRGPDAPPRGESLQVRNDPTAGPEGEPFTVVKLACRNPRETRGTVTVQAGGGPDSLIVGGHVLRIPRGAVGERPVQFTMIHHQDDRHLRVEVDTEPRLERFAAPLELGLSYETCDMTDVTPDSLVVVKDDTYVQGRARPAAARKSWARLNHLSHYALAIP